MANLKINDFSFGIPWNNLKQSPSIAYMNCNSANARAGVRFVTEGAKTLNSVAVYLARAGTVAYGEVEISIWDCNINVNSSPKNQLASTTTTLTENYVTYFNFFTGLNVSLDANTSYWIIMRNLNESPTTNYPRFGYLTAIGDQVWVGTGGYNQLERRATSTNAGDTWSYNSCAIYYILGFSDSTYAGQAIGGVGATSSNGIGQAFGDRLTGVVFKTPKGAKLNVFNCAMAIAKFGTPANDVEMQVYDKDKNLIKTSLNSIPESCMTNFFNAELFYFADLTLEPEAEYYFMLHQVNNDGVNGNDYRVGCGGYSFNNYGPGLGLDPLDGTWINAQKGIGGAWSTDNTKIPAAKIGLQTVPTTNVGGASPGGYVNV